MKGFSHREQFWSFIGLLFVIGTLGMSPIVASAYLEVSVPDLLINTIDKTISGLVGVLGMAGGLLFRMGGTETATAETNRILADKVPPATTTPPSEPAEEPKP
ncbi:MAG: hypothetical protein WC889_02750 [Myxococcota bacterium]|jgi:hypothetical protein